MNSLEIRPGRPSGVRQWLRRLCASWQLYVLVLPAMLYLVMDAYAPMYGIVIAFKKYSTSKGILGSEWVGLKHFQRFISYPAFWSLIRNTFLISLYQFLLFPIPVIVALLMNELQRQAFKRFVQMVSYAPHFLSTVVVCSMILLFTDKSKGIINELIALLGGARHDFMTDPAAFRHIYVWSGIWQGLGWSTIIYLSALSGVSPELVEAARIDGANRMQIMVHINVPTILPTAVILLIMSCGGLLSVGFDKIYLLQNDLNREVSEVISTYVYSIGISGGQFSYSAAIGLFNTVISLILLIGVNMIAKRVSDISLW